METTPPFSNKRPFNLKLRTTKMNLHAFLWPAEIYPQTQLKNALDFTYNH